MRGGAFFNGKEGRDDFRKTAPSRAGIPLGVGGGGGGGGVVKAPPPSQEGDRGVEKCYSA